jgi:hypothetical protein
MDTRKITKRKRPLPTDGDTETLNHELEAELAEDDARERKLTTISLWQVFLYHRRVPTHDEKVSIHDVHLYSVLVANSR